MNAIDRRRCLGLAALALASALAPAPVQDPPPPPPAQATPDLAALAKARGEAGLKAFDLAWLYYSEDRIGAEKVYRWSRWLLEAGRDESTDKAGRVAIREGHLERMRRLEAKIAKVRQLGFGNSLDVLEADYFLKEAELWLARAKAE